VSASGFPRVHWYNPNGIRLGEWKAPSHKEAMRTAQRKSVFGFAVAVLAPWRMRWFKFGARARYAEGLVMVVAKGNAGGAP
jgi:hypothetical protein